MQHSLSYVNANLANTMVFPIYPTWSKRVVYFQFRVCFRFWAEGRLSHYIAFSVSLNVVLYITVLYGTVGCVGPNGRVTKLGLSWPYAKCGLSGVHVRCELGSKRGRMAVRPYGANLVPIWCQACWKVALQSWKQGILKRPPSKDVPQIVYCVHK